MFAPSIKAKQNIIALLGSLEISRNIELPFRQVGGRFQRLETLFILQREHGHGHIVVARHRRKNAVKNGPHLFQLIRNMTAISLTCIGEHHKMRTAYLSPSIGSRSSRGSNSGKHHKQPNKMSTHLCLPA